MRRVFISYTREERNIAKQLADALEGASWQVWWDPHLRAGERFDDVIEAAIQDSVAVVVLWSKKSVESQYVKDEASLALRLGKLVPVTVDEVSPPFRFQNLHTIHIGDWTTPLPGPEFDSLLRDLSTIAGQSERHSVDFEPAASDHQPNILGRWQSEWRSIRSDRLHKAVLTIPAQGDARAVLEVTFERAGQQTVVLESLALTNVVGVITLIGRHFDYVTKGASTHYALDSFSLRLSADGERLEGMVYLTGGERAIVFSRIPSQ